MMDEFLDSQLLSSDHLAERDSARAERDSARKERDSALVQRDHSRDHVASLELNNAAQGTFVATLTHDLRNPIGAIKMAAEVMRSNLDPEMRSKMISLIERNADQAGELISQLLDVHLIKSGSKLPILVEECDVVSIIRKCEQSLAPRQADRITFNFDREKELRGIWDPAALERAFKNLLSNALKFSHQDKKVVITAWGGPDITTISFQNFGEVISLENQVKIFESHFRIQTTDFKQGWGLGLTLVKGVAEAHGGKVEVTSSISEGTVFSLRLPNQPRAK